MSLTKISNPMLKKGWMCEGSEDSNGKPCNAIFNNNTEEFFLADYHGNILYANTNTEPIENIKTMAKIQGDIRLVCGS